jgi:hypothetical protein
MAYTQTCLSVCLAALLLSSSAGVRSSSGRQAPACRCGTEVCVRSVVVQSWVLCRREEGFIGLRPSGEAGLVEYRLV